MSTESFLHFALLDRFLPFSDFAMYDSMLFWRNFSRSDTARCFTESFLAITCTNLRKTFISYILTRKLKDNGSVQTDTKNMENPWQNKVYKNKIGKKIIDLFTITDKE